VTELHLRALRGRNPLGLFAALGVLDACTRCHPEWDVRLRWTAEIDPTAILAGPPSVDAVIETCDHERKRWGSSSILTWGPNGSVLLDLKPHRSVLRKWLEALVANYRVSGDRTDLDLMAALLAEGAVAGTNDAKPSHFHFTAGQQKFLVMVRELQANVDAERIREALVGPWRYDSPLPVLGWDSRGERIYALRGFNPATEKKLGVPGADWLAFLGLRFFPVNVWTGPSGRPQLRRILAVVGVADGADRSNGTGVGDTVRVADRSVLAGLIHQYRIAA